MSRRLQQILIRLCRLLLRLRLRLLLDRLSLYGTRLLLRLCTRLLYRLRLRPLLLLRLLLSLTLALQRLLTLRRSLFVPRHFVQLRRLLAHVRLHLSEQLTLFVRQLIGILHFTPGRRLGRRTYARLAAFQFFNVAPALFRLRRKAVADDLVTLKGFRLFFFMMRNEVEAANKGHQHSRSNGDHGWGDSRQATLLAF